jgi:DsbC/DsbD-like thiol-disulfide interchange protein
MSMAGVIRSAVGAAAVALAIAGMRGATAEADLASPWVELANARVRLLAGPAEMPAGRSYLAGVELLLADGWKTYWRMPGDAGVPPSFDWADSRNVASVEVLYPAPTRMVEPAAVTVGYKGSVIFPVRVVPRQADQPVVLKLRMEFGICHDICIPEETTLTLGVGPAAMAGAPTTSLLAALERVPRPPAARRAGDPVLKGLTASLAGPAPRLLVEARFADGGDGADLFLEAVTAEDAYVPLPTRLADAADGTARFAVDLSRGGNPEALRGKVLRLTLVSNAGASDVTWTVR